MSRSRGLTRHDAARVPRKPQQVYRLTDREMEVLGLIAQGKTNPEIAAELYISPVTVKGHISNILAKLGVTNRTQALVFAVNKHLVTIAEHPA